MARYSLFAFSHSYSAHVALPLNDPSKLMPTERSSRKALGLKPQSLKRRMLETLRFTGEVRGARDATLSSATGGLIEAVNVSPGQDVPKGTTLVTIDTPSPRRVCSRSKRGRVLQPRHGNASKPLKMVYPQHSATKLKPMQLSPKRR